MNYGRAVGLTVAMATALFSCPVEAQDGATTRDLTALPSRAANRTVQRDLLSVLEPVPTISSGMFRQLRAVGMTTRPFGTEFEGLCRRDAVTLWYAATDTAAAPEDAPIKPYSISSSPLFHVLKLPPTGLRPESSGMFVWQSACAAIARNDTVNWFSAADARTAAQGLATLQAALSAIRIGTLRAEPCPDFFGKRTCEAAILEQSDVAKIDSIERCPSEKDFMCIAVDMAGSTKLTIKARFASDALVPDAVVSVAIEQYIIVT